MARGLPFFHWADAVAGPSFETNPQTLMKTTLKIIALTGLTAGLSLSSVLAQDSSSSSNKTVVPPSNPTSTSPAAGTSVGDGLQTSKDDVSTTQGKQTDVRNEGTVPVVQSTAPEDEKITQDVRQALKSSDNLSLKARHARVVTTADHTVYLWGKVKSDDERDRVLAIVRPLIGSRTLKSQFQLPVAGKTPQNS